MKTEPRQASASEKALLQRHQAVGRPGGLKWVNFLVLAAAWAFISIALVFFREVSFEALKKV